MIDSEVQSRKGLNDYPIHPPYVIHKAKMDKESLFMCSSPPSLHG